MSLKKTLVDIFAVASLGIGGLIFVVGSVERTFTDDHERAQDATGKQVDGALMMGWGYFLNKGNKSAGEKKKEENVTLSLKP